MKKAIVSGPDGFIGRALVRCLLDRGTEVIALCREPSAQRVDPRARKVFVSLENIRDLPRLLPDRDADCFFHLAWSGMNGPARGDYACQIQNIGWTLDTLCAAKAVNCARFVCAGSVMEKETADAAASQGSRPGTGYIYGAAKLACHAMAQSVAAKEGIDLVWAEITNAYGPGEVSPRLINSTLRKIIRGEPLRFTAGTQLYDFVYIDDAARAFCLIGEKGKPFCHYLIGSSQARPLRSYLCEIRDCCGGGDYEFGSIPYTGVSLTEAELDCAKTLEDTGFRAEIPFREGILRTMRWLRETEKENDV